MLNAIIVDDEPYCCEVLSALLEQYCKDINIVAVCNSGTEALKAIRANQPSVVFLDIEMPGMNGFQLLEKMEEFNFEVIFVTAYNDYMLNALHISALDYLLKPVDTEELKNALTRLRKKIALSGNFLHTKKQLELLG